MADVSSANPQQLESAGQAVSPDLQGRLLGAIEGLGEKINSFNAAPQSPELLKVPSDFFTGQLTLAVNTGAQLDSFLLRVAEAFRIAGGDHDPSFIGPVVPSPSIRYLDDATLGAQLGAWNSDRSLEFRVTGDGKHEVQGPNGVWYSVLPFAPLGSRPLGQSGAQTVDFGNPDFGLTMSAAILTQGQYAPMFRPAPPSAYESLQFNEDGYLISSQDVGGQSSSPRGRVPSLPARGAALYETEHWSGLVEGSMAGATQAADFRHRGVVRTQATFYVDPQSQQHVAVVDAATVSYSKDFAHVNSGRLDFDQRGLPTLAPHLDVNNCDVSGAPPPPPSFRIPLKAGN